MNAEFKAAIRSALAHNATLGEFVVMLRSYKDVGMSRQDALDNLESLRREYDDEADDDTILEILDIVTDWCSPRYRVW